MNCFLEIKVMFELHIKSMCYNGPIVIKMCGLLVLIVSIYVTKIWTSGELL